MVIKHYPLTQECERTVSRRSDRTYGTGPRWRISQAINCLATFIQSLRDPFKPKYAWPSS